MKYTNNTKPSSKAYATIYGPVRSDNNYIHACINFCDSVNSSLSGTMLIIELKSRCKKLGIKTIFDISHSTKIIGLNKDNAIKHNCKYI